MSAAQMRKMMEGVVLYGTGRQAQLNGYSSGGKTGTAQKIDPATHTYSKTMHIASFAGIAPVNSPVIAVAVVLDDPKGGGISYYGGAASAPVFTQVAQGTLEYLRIPHDVEVRAPHSPSKTPPVKDAEPEQEHTGDVTALMAAVNDLPPDDPLREAVDSARAASSPAVVKVKVPSSKAVPEKSSEKSASSPDVKSKFDAAAETVSVSLPAGKSVKVPSLIGMPVRQVVEQVAMAGLMLQVDGRGLVRSQEPAAGSAVQPGTQVIVHCAR
jgi:cell division protein FtsI (penicillin-binding protein 3)